MRSVARSILFSPFVGRLTALKSNLRDTALAKFSFLNNLFGAKPNMSVSPYKEAGVSGTVIYNGMIQDREKNRSLNGIQKFLTYEDILANVTIVSASVRFYTALVANPDWSVEPADDSSEAQYYADLFTEIIHDQDRSFSSIVRNTSMYKFNGFSVSEMTAKKRDDGIIGLKSIETRPCRTITRWDVDEQGNVVGFIQTKPSTATEIYIPRKKAVYLVDELMTDSPEGFGIFRAIAETANRLRDIQMTEKIGIDRDLRGTPVGRAPIALLNQAMQNGEITKEQFEAATKGLEDLLQTMKKSTDTSILLDSKTYESQSENGRSVSSVAQWDVSLLSGDNASTLSETDKVIRRLNMEIARSMGTESLLVGDGSTGSLALSKDKSRNLMLNVNSTLKDIADQYNKDIIPFLRDLNGWPKELMPKLVPAEISQRDVEEISSFFRDMATSGVPLNRNDKAVEEVFNMVGFTPPNPEDEVELTQEEGIF